MESNLRMQFDQMKKKLIVIFVIFVIILLIMLGFYYYSIIQQAKYDHLGKTTKAISSSGELNEIENIYQFYDMEGYHIFEGADEDSKERFIFVPIETYQKMSTWYIQEKATIQTADQTKEQVLNACQSCHIKYITPAFMDETALWEIALTDGKGTYILQYIEMETGKQFDFLSFQ